LKRTVDSYTALITALVTGCVAVVLFVGVLAELLGPGDKVGWLRGGFVRHWRTIAPVLYFFAGAGAIWLGVRISKINMAVNSITKRINCSDKIPAKRIDNDVVQKLSDAVRKRLKSHIEAESELARCVKEFQIQTRLSKQERINTEAIIYSIRDAVVVVDEFDKIVMANKAAGRLFDFDFSKVQHKPIKEIIGDDKKDFVRFLRESRQKKLRGRKKEIQFFAGEQPKVFDCIVSSIYEQDDTACGVVAILHDITREKEISQMKNDFVSHVSHELKTPLSSITAYSEMLCDGEAEDPKMREEFYSVIQNQAKRLKRMIDDILNISRIESGLVKVSKEPMSLTILIQEQLRMIQSYASEKSISIVSQKPIVHDQIYADKDMLSQVLVNLLSNGIKYTPRGGTVGIEVEVDEDRQLARVKITDTGVGIGPEELEHVFDKFYRVKENEKKAKGTGLGLNLVKQIIEKVHGGRVFVTSQKGKGSTFAFELPLAKREAVADAT